MEKLWERIKKSIVEGVSAAAEKTEEFTKLGKMKIDVLNTKRKISKSFTELGGIIYEAFKGRKTEEVMKSAPVEKILSSLQIMENELEQKEQKYEEMKKKSEKTDKPECNKEEDVS